MEVANEIFEDWVRELVNSLELTNKKIDALA